MNMILFMQSERASTGALSDNLVMKELLGVGRVGFKPFQVERIDSRFPATCMSTVTTFLLGKRMTSDNFVIVALNTFP